MIHNTHTHTTCAPASPIDTPPLSHLNPLDSAGDPALSDGRDTQAHTAEQRLTLLSTTSPMQKEAEAQRCRPRPPPVPQPHPPLSTQLHRSTQLLNPSSSGSTRSPSTGEACRTDADDGLARREQYTRTRSIKIDQDGWGGVSGTLGKAKSRARALKGRARGRHTTQERGRRNTTQQQGQLTGTGCGRGG